MGNSNNDDDAYVYNIPNLNESKVKDEYKIAFIGESGTGAKTSLMNRLRGVKFSEDLTSTISLSFSDMKIKLRKKKVTLFKLWEIPSKEKYMEQAKLCLGNLDCALIGYNINNRKSYEEAINH